MNKTAKPDGAAPKHAKRDKHTHAVQGGSSEANRTAIVILEVLAGMRSPADAASALGISLVRYYQLEVRALEGFVAALEPRPRGKQVSAESQLKTLEKQLLEAAASALASKRSCEQRSEESE